MNWRRSDRGQRGWLPLRFPYLWSACRGTCGALRLAGRLDPEPDASGGFTPQLPVAPAGVRRRGARRVHCWLKRITIAVWRRFPETTAWFGSRRGDAIARRTAVSVPLSRGRRRRQAGRRDGVKYGDAGTRRVRALRQERVRARASHRAGADVRQGTHATRKSARRPHDDGLRTARRGVQVTRGGGVLTGAFDARVEN